MLLRIEKELRECGYLLFIKANIIIVDQIGEEILPSVANDGLLAVKHPGYWDKPVTEYTYDRNSASAAFIPPGTGKHYFMGGFNGGETAAYLRLIKTLNNNIDTDLDKNIIALWHDESHLNKYLLDKNPRILSPAYGFAEGQNLPFKPKVLVLSKEKYGGHDYLRNISPKKQKPPSITLRKINNAIGKLSGKLSPRKGNG